MKKPVLIISLLLSLLVMLNTVSASTAVITRSRDEIIDAAMTIIYRNEGNYGSINKNDNGAVSIGKVQWHATRALNLLKSIVNDDPMAAYLILGADLYNEIITATGWESRIVNDTEAAALRELLLTDHGKAEQDALAQTDIGSYVNSAINYGMTAASAIVYYADLENQWGYYGARPQVQNAAAAAGSYAAITLDDLHTACLAYTKNYHARRTAVYNYCLSLKWEDILPGDPFLYISSGDCEVGTVISIIPSASNAGYYSINITDKSTKESVFNNSSFTGTVIWIPMRAGSYSIDVKCCNQHGSVSIDTVTINVAAPYPERPVLNGSGNSIGIKDKLCFTWESVQKSTRYELNIDCELSEGAYFPIYQNSNAQSGDGPVLSAGEYRAQLVAYNDNYLFDQPENGRLSPAAESEYYYFAVRDTAILDVSTAAGALSCSVCGDSNIAQKCYIVLAGYNSGQMVDCEVREIELTAEKYDITVGFSQQWTDYRIMLLNKEYVPLVSLCSGSR